MAADLLLVDAKNLWHRCAHGVFGGDSSGSKLGPDGLTIHTFLATLLRVQREEGGLPVVVWEGENNWRFDVYPDYKGNRRPAPSLTPEEFEARRMVDESLEAGLASLRELLTELGIRQCEPVAGEADDAIATLALKMARRGSRVSVFSGDHDLLALAGAEDGRVRVVCPGHRGSVKVYAKAEDVVKKLGVRPEQVPDFKAIAGDKSDNVPGAKGLGPKRAVEILETYGDLSTALDAAGSAAWMLSPKWGEALSEARAALETFFRVVSLDTAAALVHRPGSPDRAAALARMRRIGLRELAKAGPMARISRRLAA